MKKTSKFIAVLLALMLALSAAPAFAAETEKAPDITDESRVKPAALQKTFDLSLEDALLKLDTDSVQAELIEIQRMGDEAAAKGSAEGLEKLEDAQKALNQLGSMAYATGNAVVQSAYESASFSMTSTFASKDRLRLTRDFAAAMLEPNAEARKNSLHYTATEMYYNLKNLEMQLQIAEDNARIMRDVYELTKKKYDLGTASKMELMNAESNMNSARLTADTALDGLNQLRMGFNIYFGYNLSQSVNLTSELDETPLSSIDVTEGIRLAKENRISIKQAEYKLKLAAEDVAKYRYYPKNSTSYIGGRAQFLAASVANNMAKSTVEMEVRNNFSAMTRAYSAVQLGKTSVENAVETARLARLQYEAGYATYTTVEQAQLGSYSAQIQQAQNLLTLKLAVDKYELSTGVGTEAASLVG